MKRYKLIRILFILYLAAVAYLCFSNSGGLPQMLPAVFSFPGSDKLVHFLMFFPFVPLLWFSLGGSASGLSRKTLERLFLVCGTGLAFGVATEIVQAFIPYRAADVKDLLADTLGIAASALILVAHIRKKRQNENR